MNLPSPYQILMIALFTSIGLGTAFAADEDSPRVNPFALPAGVYSKDNIPEQQAQSLKLEAIFKINGKYTVTISGENFTKDDFAFGKRILNIAENRVLLDAAGEEETLVLHESKFSLQSRNRK